MSVNSIFVITGNLDIFSNYSIKPELTGIGIYSFLTTTNRQKCESYIAVTKQIVNKKFHCNAINFF